MIFFFSVCLSEILGLVKDRYNVTSTKKQIQMAASNFDLDKWSKFLLKGFTKAVFESEPYGSFQDEVDRTFLTVYFLKNKPSALNLFKRIYSAWYELNDDVDFESRLTQVFEVLYFNEKVYVAYMANEFYLQERAELNVSLEIPLADKEDSLKQYQKSLSTIFSALKRSKFSLDEEELMNQEVSDWIPIKTQLERLRQDPNHFNAGFSPYYNDPVVDQILDLFKETRIEYAGKQGQSQIIAALRMSGGNVKLAVARLLRD